MLPVVSLPLIRPMPPSPKVYFFVILHQGGRADGEWARIAKEEGKLVTEPWIEVDGPGGGGVSG